MNNFGSLPPNPSRTLISGVAQQIRDAISYESDKTAAKLDEAKSYRAIGDEKISHYASLMAGAMTKTTNIMALLMQADRKIQKNMNADPILKQYSERLKKYRREDSILARMDYMDEQNIRSAAPIHRKIAASIRLDICQALKYRIEMGGIWHKIAEIRRSIMVEYTIFLAQHLTAIAIVLQDDRTIDGIRSILKNLHLSLPPYQSPAMLEPSPEELRRKLREGIEEIERTYHDLQLLDEEQNEIKTVLRQLSEASGDLKTWDEIYPTHATQEKEHCMQSGMHITPKYFQK
ncbi:MAG: hypothetical protein AB1656_18865 [Candidatus Omnitrophota bacterium]